MDKLLMYTEVEHTQSPSTTDLYLTHIGVVGHGSEVREGMVWQWGEMKAYSIPTQIFLGEMSC